MLKNKQRCWCSVVTVVLLSLGLAHSCLAVSAKTFFMPRSVGQDAVLEQATLHHFIHSHEPSPHFTFEIAPFYQESTNSKDIASYFLPSGKTSLSIQGATSANRATADISALWLLIAGQNTRLNPPPQAIPPAPHFPGVAGFADAGAAALYFNEYSSTISIKPEIKTFGASLSLYKAFDCTNNRVWFSLFMPVTQVETNVKLKEYAISSAVGTRGAIDGFVVRDHTDGTARFEQPTLGNMLSAVEAFNNPFWKYGKIKQGVQQLTGLADIKMKLGWRVADGKFIHCDVYPSLIIPTGYKPKSEYLFEPVIGNAQHLGFGGGATINFAFIHKTQKYVGLGSNVEYHYLFRGTERRSFDLLANGPWSRYLLVYQPTIDPLLVQPGINFFTKDVKVTPQSELNWLTTLHAGYHAFFIEAGYDLWWKDREKVVLKNAWTEQIAIAGLFKDLDVPFTLNSVSRAKISDSSYDDVINNPDATQPTLVQSSDLNLGSAAHPSRISN